MQEYIIILHSLMNLISKAIEFNNQIMSNLCNLFDFEKISDFYLKLWNMLIKKIQENTYITDR